VSIHKYAMHTMQVPGSGKEGARSPG